MSTERHFFLHEDEWAMIDIMPTENMEESLRVAREAEEFGRVHYDGGGWTDMYIIPEPKHPIAERRIMLSDVRALVSARLEEADVISSGIRPGEQVANRSYAFGNQHAGALYGHHTANLIEGLYFLPPDPDDLDESAERFWRSVLFALGTRYRLILADWWSKLLVDLNSEEMIHRYLQRLAGDPKGD